MSVIGTNTKEGARPDSTWLVEFKDGAVWIKRLSSAAGHSAIPPLEVYRPLPSSVAAVALVAISQGYQPPRSLQAIDTLLEPVSPECSGDPVTSGGRDERN